MPPLIVNTLVNFVSSEVKTLVFDQVMMAWGADKEFKKILNTMKTLDAVILDAEEQQNENHQVKDWLSKVQDIMYDMTDVADDCRTEALKVELGRSCSLFLYNKVTRVYLQFTFKLGLAYKIRAIRENLNDINHDKQSLHLCTEVRKHKIWVQEGETHSFASTALIGRQAEKDYVVSILTNSSQNVKLSCHAIVGIGGLGKTSLAKLVYNDPRIESQFPIRIWVHVSLDFNLKKILRCIVGMEGLKEAIGSLPLEDLQMKLREKIQGEKILLVLDDVWLENPTQWCELQDFLMVSAVGSKVLVTTRNQSIAKIVGVNNIYHLHGLSDEDCWYLLAASAFGRGCVNQEITKHPNLVTIGKQIAKKDEGVPLVVTALGEMLSGNTDEEKWLRVQHEHIWKMNEGADRVMSVLELSYNVLPPYAKKCFLYCCIYPKRHQMHKETLKQLWIAQGYFQPSDGQFSSVEEAANGCFDLLVSRSFFQDLEEDDYFQSTLCRMHDLVHDFGSFMSQNDNVVIDLDEEATDPISENTHHICFQEPSALGTPTNYNPMALLGLKRLRTLLWAPASSKVQQVTWFPIDLCLKTFQSLRVLNLSGMQIEVLPNSTGNLTHLRYLSLSRNTSIKRLPGSIRKLFNLETLRLDKCIALEGLPARIEELPKLKHLYITSKQKELTILKMARSASSLRTLFIDNCVFLEVFPGCLERFRHVEKLRFTNCPNAEVETNTMEGMLNLKHVTLGHFPNMTCIPNSLNGAVSTLQTLYVSDCPRLIKLPEWLARCTHLKRLTIINCPELKYLPDGLENLYDLKVVKIKGCPSLKDRCERERGQDCNKIAKEIYVDGVQVN